jgi:hypothetical protein
MISLGGKTRAQVLQMKWKGISAHAKKLREKAAEEEKLRQKRNDAAVEEATVGRLPRQPDPISVKLRSQPQY